MQFIKPDTHFDFIGKRKIAFALSALLVLSAILSLIWKGPLLGVDFAGGTAIQIKFDSAVRVDDIKTGLGASRIGQASVQEYGPAGNHEYLIRTIQTEESFEDFATEIKTLLKTSTGMEPDIRSVEMVGPQVGADLRKKALLAMFYSLVLIILYISARFETGWINENKWVKTVAITVALIGSVYALSMVDVSIAMLISAALIIAIALCWLFDLKFAIGAIIALIHDVTITVGIFIILGKEFTLPIIAALLTIIGYSLNDTIIVYDRIRENLSKSFSRKLDVIINRSVNETLNRTLMTSGTTLAVLICLFVLGGGVIHDFAFSMIVGVIIGTYSSIFVASPMLLLWQGKTAKQE